MKTPIQQARAPRKRSALEISRRKSRSGPGLAAILIAAFGFYFFLKDTSGPIGGGESPLETIALLAFDDDRLPDETRVQHIRRICLKLKAGARAATIEQLIDQPEDFREGLLKVEARVIDASDFPKAVVLGDAQGRSIRCRFFPGEGAALGRIADGAMARFLLTRALDGQPCPFEGGIVLEAPAAK